MPSFNKKIHCPTCNCQYETFIQVHEDSVSDYYPELDELPGGQVFVNVNSLSAEERKEHFKQFGPSINKELED